MIGNQQKIMIKQVIVDNILLIIYDALKAFKYIQAILDFEILAYNVRYDEKMLRYMEHLLYKLESTKIIFE